jgi:hypothetical protein
MTIKLAVIASLLLRRRRGNLYFWESRKKGDCFLSLVMTRRWCRFAPSSDNAEDRELEGVPNVMELYTLFPNPFLFAIIYAIFGEQRS